MEVKHDFSITSLGARNIPSPLNFSNTAGDAIANFVDDDDMIRYSIAAKVEDSLEKKNMLERAGPRGRIYFNPSHVHAAIVTCGGLCPGLNDVIRAVTRCLWYRYGVRRISGIRFGYKGFLPEYGFELKPLDPDTVDDIHKIGGTLLGSSRGGGDRTADIVDALERLNVNVLFTVGGDGTQKGALAISEEIARRGLRIGVVGIPKTIDNDLLFIDRSFGFETAVARAAEAVTAAHTEAHSSINGIGLVKLMGRDAGFIAVHTILAVHEANFVLIPEVPFALEGRNGLLELLEQRLAKRNHAVIVVAEGAGQGLLPKTDATDASGNKRYGDIGTFLRDQIAEHFSKRKIHINLKYIDPSYMVRSSPADPGDSVYCERLGNNAVHAAMAGKTAMLVGVVHGEFIHIPIATAVAERKKVDPESSLWRDAIEATQQPLEMV